jgi:hypothetical protein
MWIFATFLVSEVNTLTDRTWTSLLYNTEGLCQHIKVETSFLKAKFFASVIRFQKLFFFLLCQLKPLIIQSFLCFFSPLLPLLHGSEIPLKCSDVISLYRHIIMYVYVCLRSLCLCVRVARMLPSFLTFHVKPSAASCYINGTCIMRKIQVCGVSGLG